MSDNPNDLNATADDAVPTNPLPPVGASEQKPPSTPRAASAAVKSVVYPRVQSAIRFTKEHPLGAVATVAAATALIEVELAVGILAGLGATALLATKTGSEAREEVLSRSKVAREQVVARSKVAFTRAKTAWEGRIKPKAKQATEASAPPS
jgi:hypothetical protein